MFSPNIVERAKTTLAEHGSSSHHDAPLQDEEPFHLDTDMVDMEVNEENKTREKIIMEKDARSENLRRDFQRPTFWFHSCSKRICN